MKKKLTRPQKEARKALLESAIEIVDSKLHQSDANGMPYKMTEEGVGTLLGEVIGEIVEEAVRRYV